MMLLHARYAAAITICNPHFKLANLLVLTKDSLVCQSYSTSQGQTSILNRTFFLSFGKRGFHLNKVIQAAKTHGSCKPNAHWCANLTARARDRP